MTMTAPVPVAPVARMRYGGLVVLMLMSFLLVTAEFLPNGVLTEMAAGLGITPGQAGQTVTVTAGGSASLTSTVPLRHDPRRALPPRNGDLDLLVDVDHGRRLAVGA